MRTFQRRERYPISSDNEISVFEGELEYYRSHNQHAVILFGRSIVNIYKNINVQVVVSKKCNFTCPFCIENDRTSCGNAETPPDKIFECVIAQYACQGITPNVSITGGEPTLFPNRLRKIYATVKKWNIPHVNINTNGAIPHIFKEMDGVKINLSRHHYTFEKNKAIFGGGQISPLIIDSNYSMQCVMMKGYIDSVAEMKKYMEFYILRGAGGFSFRGMSTLDVSKEYSKEIDFTVSHTVDFFAILNEVSNDPDFEFVQQKIGDHYCFEIYKYKGKPVRFTYSNFEFLRKIETEERRNGQWFSRATVISPFGKVYAGWTYDINEIL